MDVASINKDQSKSPDNQQKFKKQLIAQQPGGVDESILNAIYNNVFLQNKGSQFFSQFQTVKPQNNDQTKKEPNPLTNAVLSNVKRIESDGGDHQSPKLSSPTPKNPVNTVKTHQNLSRSPPATQKDILSTKRKSKGSTQTQNSPEKPPFNLHSYDSIDHINRIASKKQMRNQSSIESDFCIEKLNYFTQMENMPPNSIFHKKPSFGALICSPQRQKDTMTQRRAKSQEFFPEENQKGTKTEIINSIASSNKANNIQTQTTKASIDKFESNQKRNSKDGGAQSSKTNANVSPPSDIKNVLKTDENFEQNYYSQGRMQAVGGHGKSTSSQSNKRKEKENIEPNQKYHHRPQIPSMGGISPQILNAVNSYNQNLKLAIGSQLFDGFVKEKNISGSNSTTFLSHNTEKKNISVIQKPEFNSPFSQSNNHNLQDSQTREEYSSLKGSFVEREEPQKLMFMEQKIETIENNMSRLMEKFLSIEDENQKLQLNVYYLKNDQQQLQMENEAFQWKIHELIDENLQQKSYICSILGKNNSAIMKKTSDSTKGFTQSSLRMKTQASTNYLPTEPDRGLEIDHSSFMIGKTDSQRTLKASPIGKHQEKPQISFTKLLKQKGLIHPASGKFDQYNSYLGNNFKDQLTPIPQNTSDEKVNINYQMKMN